MKNNRDIEVACVCVFVCLKLRRSVVISEGVRVHAWKDFLSRFTCERRSVCVLMGKNTELRRFIEEIRTTAI